MYQGIIYYLAVDNYPLVYIGSTFKPLRTRLLKHKSDFLTNKPISSVELFKLGKEVFILPIEIFNCNDEKQLRTREGEYIAHYREICVNKINPTPWSIQDRKDYKHKHHELNKERYNYMSKLRFEDVKDDPEFKQKRKDKYQREKDKLLEKHLCICGRYYTFNHKERHEQSHMHQKYLSSMT